MALYSVVTFTPESPFITLHSEDAAKHTTLDLRVNMDALRSFLTDDRDACFCIDDHSAFRAYRISDSAVSVHLLWHNAHDQDAYSRCFVLPVQMLLRVLSGKKITAVVDNNLRYYDCATAYQIFGVAKAYCL